MRVVLTAHIGTKYLFEGRLKSQINGKAHVSVAGLTEVVYALPPGEFRGSVGFERSFI